VVWESKQLRKKDGDLDSPFNSLAFILATIRAMSPPPSRTHPGPQPTHPLKLDVIQYFILFSLGPELLLLRSVLRNPSSCGL
jgi:hypothetical protein